MKINLPFHLHKQQPEQRPDEREAVRKSYAQLLDRLGDIRSRFDMAVEEDVIDALIYEENAVLCRLAQLYKQARAEGITLEHYEQIKPR